MAIAAADASGFRPHASGLEIRVAHDPQSYVLALHGELDPTCLRELRSALERAERSRAPEIVVDLSALRYVHRVGLRELSALHHRLRGGRRLALLAGRHTARLALLPGLAGLLQPSVRR